MKTIAVIPARGGSVGLPGKNIKLLNGIPLVARSVLAAKQSQKVSEVYVSSDADNILAVAEKYGAKGIKRPKGISGSIASSESALLHALCHLKENGEEPADILVFLQCTSPFTTSEHIDNVLLAMEKTGADSAFSAIENHGFIWQIGKDGLAKGITHDEQKPRQRRQDMSPRYLENGAIYAMKIPQFIESGNRFCGRTVLVPIEVEPIEIDTPEDWAIAEVIASQKSDELKVNPSVYQGVFRAVIMDFDGVHTDDRVIVHEDGTEAVICSRSDGMGIEILRNKGVKLLILSREQNPVVQTRAKKLKLEIQNHVLDKFPALDAWRIKNNLEWHQIAYIGNDINDIECMRQCGMSFCPADAHTEAKNIATVTLKEDGGRGALRELSEFLLSNGLLG